MRLLRYKKIFKLVQGKYLRYAIGEIILVVIGILIALQVNNLNEERKLRIQEKNVLLSLHNEISSNLLSLETSLNEKKTILQVNTKLLKNSSPLGEWRSKEKLDSLMYYFTVSGWIYVPDNGVLNEIVNSGKLSDLKNTSPSAEWRLKEKLDSLMYYFTVSGWIYVPDNGVINEIVNSGKLSDLENNSIKNLVASIPQQVSQILEEDRLYRDDLHQYFLPYLGQKFALKNITKYRELYNYNRSALGESNFDIDYSKILGDLEFENILTIQAIWIKFSIEMCENLKFKYLKLQSLIEKKYPKVDYDKLEENLENGFWG